MSSRANYSQSPNNIYGLTDEEISKYYDLVEEQIVGSKYGYLVHYPKTEKDRLNPHFIRDKIVKMASEYYYEFRKKNCMY